MARLNENLSINSVSRISTGTICKGEIYSQYDIRVDGTFEGKLHSKGRVVVGENAVVSGDIVCDNVDLWGKFSGELFVKDTLVLKSGCSVGGSINVRRFMVELGSEFNGSCKMISEEDYDKIVGKIEEDYSPNKGKSTKPLETKETDKQFASRKQA